MKKCCVLGLGYIGLPTAALIADSGYKVYGYDINKEIVKKVNNSDINIVENNLKKLVQKVVNSQNLVAVDEITFSDVFVITVPTPFKKSKNSIPEPDISYVKNAAKEIAKVIKENDLVILESTSPVNTTRKVAEIISEKSGLTIDEFNLCYCPERVIPGNILIELQNNDRVIGCENHKSGELAKKFYKSFCNGEIILTSVNTAELCKLAENAFRDVNIAYANELSMICDDLSINVRELIALTNLHPRVNILKPGCGVGGHCIAVDPWFIASGNPEKSHLIQSARKVNMQKVKWSIDKISLEAKKFYKREGKEPLIACLGLSYKANIDDYRESPALEIFESLKKEGFNVVACDPHIEKINSILIKDLDYIKENADLIIALVNHSCFEKIDFNDKLLIDLCGLKK